jgi:hypothetical protein
VVNITSYKFYACFGILQQLEDLGRHKFNFAGGTLMGEEITVEAVFNEIFIIK